MTSDREALAEKIFDIGLKEKDWYDECAVSTCLIIADYILEHYEPKGKQRECDNVPVAKQDAFLTPPSICEHGWLDGSIYCYKCGCSRITMTKPSPSAEFKTKLPEKMQYDGLSGLLGIQDSDIIKKINEILDFLKERG
jgi:hypothetical protein